jgi:hypothetical protein
MLRAVLDTNILISARRSRTGASNELLRRLDRSSFQMLASVPLFLEYEAVLTRPEHLLATGLDLPCIHGFLGYLAGLVEPVKLHYLWRPQLSDLAARWCLRRLLTGGRTTS